MSDSISKSDKSSSKSSGAKAKDTGSGDASTSKSADSDGGKSARESIGGKSEIHYGFFSSVRTPEYRSGWDDIWGKNNNGRPGKKSAKARSNGNAKSGAKPATVDLKIADLPDDVRHELVEAARRKLGKSRAGYDKLEASGKVDWTISVTVNGGRG